MLSHRPVIFVLAAHLAMTPPLLATGAQIVPRLTTSDPMLMRVNGLTLDVRSAVVPVERESLATAVLEAWRAAGTEGKRFDAEGDRLVLGRQTGPLHETLSLLRTPDPLATAVIRALQDSRQMLASGPPPPLPLPEDMRVVGTVESLTGQTPYIIHRLESRLRPRDAAEQLRAIAVNQQWEVEARRFNEDGSAMVRANRKGESMMINAFYLGEKTSITLMVEYATP